MKIMTDAAIIAAKTIQNGNADVAEACVDKIKFENEYLDLASASICMLPYAGQ